MDPKRDRRGSHIVAILSIMSGGLASLWFGPGLGQQLADGPAWLIPATVIGAMLVAILLGWWVKKQIRQNREKP